LGSIFSGLGLPLLVKSERILAEAVFFAILVLMMVTTFTVTVEFLARYEDGAANVVKSNNLSEKGLVE
jgi:hypothetical protein